MTLKSIVVVACGDGSDAEVIGTAGKLAARFGAQVSVTPAFPDPAADLVYYGAALQTAPEAVERIIASERAAQERLESLGRDVAARESVMISVEKRSLMPAVTLAPAAILADLVLFAGAAARSAIAPLFAETLLSTRAPILLTKGAAFAGGPVAIAWDGSGQAARAARAAMPLLQAASGVVVLRNVDDETEEAEASSPEHMRAYLTLHGVKNIALRDLRGARVAESLLSAARADKCELLVSGAYGRPRLFEMVLGGTTRTLVHAPEAPSLLLAH
ncbi:MAG: universal stress protein [Caulobacteraceae bacterium]|nr:universal stress protein [Caulobacteraceae bacterium]